MSGRTRWMGTVGGMVVLMGVAFVGGRVVDAVTTVCSERPVEGVMIYRGPSNQLDQRGSASVAAAARQASAELSFEVRPPCPSPATDFDLKNVGIGTFEREEVNQFPYVSWSFVPRASVRPEGASVTRAIRVEQYADEVPYTEGAQPVALGIAEDRAFRRHSVVIEAPLSDQLSSESLSLHVYAKGGTYVVYVLGPPGELPDEGKIVAMLQQMIR